MSTIVKVSRIRIKNFKSFKDVEFKVKDKDDYFPNIFIGKNDVGKSNLLQALNLKNIFQKKMEKSDFYSADQEQSFEFLIRLEFPFLQKIKNILRFYDLKMLSIRPREQKLWSRRLDALSTSNQVLLVLMVYRKQWESDCKIRLALETNKGDKFFLEDDLLGSLRGNSEFLKEKGFDFQNFNSLLDDLQKNLNPDKLDYVKEKINDLVSEVNNFSTNEKTQLGSKNHQITKNLFVALIDLFGIFWLFKAEIWDNSHFVSSKEYSADIFQQSKYLSFDKDKVGEILSIFTWNMSEQERNMVESSLVKRQDWENLEEKERREINNLLEFEIPFDNAPVLSAQINGNALSFSVEENNNFDNVAQRSDGFQSNILFKYLKAKLLNQSKEKEDANRKNEFLNSSCQNKELKKIVEESLEFLRDNLQLKFLLIDEPETHLYPDIQEKILKDLISFSNKERVNLFVSTHSPHFISWDNYCDNTGVVLKKKNSKESKIYSSLSAFANEEKETLGSYDHSLRPIEVGLGIKLNFVFPKTGDKYILVEGKDDFVIYNFMFRKFFSKNRENWKFLPVDSNTDNYFIDLCVLFNLPFLVVFDSDIEGKETGIQKIQSLKEKFDWLFKKPENCLRFKTLNEIMLDKTNALESFFSKSTREIFFNSKNNKVDRKKFTPCFSLLEKELIKLIDAETREKFERFFSGISNFFQKCSDEKVDSKD